MLTKVPERAGGGGGEGEKVSELVESGVTLDLNLERPGLEFRPDSHAHHVGPQFGKNCTRIGIQKRICTLFSLFGGLGGVRGTSTARFGGASTPDMHREHRPLRLHTGVPRS